MESRFADALLNEKVGYHSTFKMRADDLPNLIRMVMEHNRERGT